MTELDIPAAGTARVHVLHEGYVGRDGDDERVSGTVTLITDSDAVIVVDPGMVADRGALLAALAAHGPRPADVTDVVFSHHHPGHTVTWSNPGVPPAAGYCARPVGHAALVARRDDVLPRSHGNGGTAGRETGTVSCRAVNSPLGPGPQTGTAAPRTNATSFPWLTGY